jgi:isoquinoline 1-oxidoreductase beta subunit
MDELLGREGKVVGDVGGAPEALAGAARRIEASYDVPYQAHAPMEPMNATVHVRADGAEAWIGSQGPDWPQRAIAKIAGVDPGKVVVHTTLLGGAFGRRYCADHPVEAAQISKVVGAPIQLVWTREDDFRHDFYRPAARHRLAAGLDGSGQPVAWHHRMASQSIAAYWGWGPDPAASEVGGALNLPYAIPARRMEYAFLESPVPIMWWRSVEHSGNAFVVESFVDELAHAAGADPLEFRLRLLAGSRKVTLPGPEGMTLDTARLAAVLELAAARAGWKQPLPAGRARGIAGHFSFDSYVAQVAEVSLVGGKPRVHRIVAAVDCGRVMHPDNLAAQVEGAIVYGLSATLKSAITIDKGQSVQTNFDGFALLRIDEMPVVEVHTVASDAAPTGIGEPGLPPVAPAVANALFALTGKRVRKLPILAADLA